MFRIELITLYAFALVLPMLEAPKNLLWAAYAVLWMANRVRTRSFGGNWTSLDTLLLAWIVSGYMSAYFAGIRNNEWLSAFDILRYGSMLWMLKRSGYEPDAMRRLFLCILAGTASALVRGGYELWFSKIHVTLGLNSVGHVNHSAIYVAIAFVAALAWLRGAWNAGTKVERLAGLAAGAMFVFALFVMASRGAVGVAFIAAIAVLSAFAVRSEKSLKPVLVVSVLAAASVLIAKPHVVEKNEAYLKENMFLANREGVWRVALEAWKEFPAFGVGMGNFGRIDRQRIDTWRRERGETPAQVRLDPASHGHSLFLNTLAERGLVGLTVLLAVLGWWAWILARTVPHSSAPAIRWAYWGGALGALLVAVLVGLVNTTLHHEHALLSVLLLGGWLALQGGERDKS